MSNQARVRVVARLAALALSATTLPAQLTWRTIGTAVPPRAGHYAFFDAPRGRVLVFGGQTTATTYGTDCYELDGTDWVQVSSPNLQARGHSPSCEDPSLPGNGVIFSGRVDNGTLLAETLRFDAQRLRFDTLQPAQSPQARWISAMAYDSTRRRAVLFGGGDSSGPLGDTWEWDGSNWLRRIPPFGPTARANHAMTYDAARQRVVLFGGHDGLGSLSDMWSYDGSVWTNITPPRGPGALHDVMLAFDDARRVVVLFGGKNDAGIVNNDTWEWDGNVWTQRTPAARPPARELASLTYDQQRRRLVLVGGQGQGGNLLADAWAYDGNDWREIVADDGSRVGLVPGARHGAAAVYDAVRGRIVYYGGATTLLGGETGATFEREGRSWSQRGGGGPPPRSYMAAAVLRDSGELCVHGGYVAAGLTDNGLWRFDGTRWVYTTLTGSVPPVCVGASMASHHHSTLGPVLVHFGGTVSGALNSITRMITPSGQCSVIATGNAPPSRDGAAMTASLGPPIGNSGMYMFGGVNAGLYPNDLWSLSETGGAWNWAQLTPQTGTPVPPGRLFCALAYHAQLQRLYLFGGFNRSLGILDDLWYWQNGRWFQVTAPGPAARAGAALVYDESLNLLVLIGGYDNSSVRDDIWHFDGAGWSRTDAVPPQRPAGRSDFGLTYDTTHGDLVLFGGETAPGVSDETWVHDGGWTRVVGVGTSPPARRRPTMFFDERVRQSVLFGGLGSSTTLDDTWHFDGDGWTENLPQILGPSPRAGAVAVYDPVRQRGAMLGGVNGSAWIDEFWLYDAVSRTWARAGTGPGPRAYHAMAYDRKRGRIVVFGGRNGASLLDETWEFVSATSTWVLRTPAPKPSARERATMAYDGARGRVVLVGGLSASGALADCWEWNGSEWSQRTPETLAPMARHGAGAAWHAGRSRVVLCGGYSFSNGLLADVDEFYAPIDTAGRGMLVNPLVLAYYSQPVLGGVLRLGFDNPLGAGVLFLDAGPVQAPLFQLAAPLCGVANIYTSLQTSVGVGGNAQPNVSLSVPNVTALHGNTLVLQGAAYQPGTCLVATDARHARL